MTKKQKKKKELRERQSTRQLMGIDRITRYGVKTAHGDLAFFLVQPDNLSVLSSEGIRGRVHALTELLSGTDGVIMMALDSRESFRRNKDCYRQKLEKEPLPALRELLRQDAAHLDSIQTATASAREFILAVPLEKQEAGDPESRLLQLEKNLRDRGFRLRLAGEQDVKRILAVYYQQDVTTEVFCDFDGQSAAESEASYG